MFKTLHQNKFLHDGKPSFQFLTLILNSLKDNLFLNLFFHPIKLFSYNMEALVGVVILCNDFANYNFLTGRVLERWCNYISFLMFEGYLIQGWVTGPNYFLGIFLRSICFGNNTRLFVPFKMVFKVFKERNIVGYLFYEFSPFCQNFFSFGHEYGWLYRLLAWLYFFLGQILYLRLPYQG